jgi:hypothetical protein
MPTKPALHLLGFRFPMPKNKAPRTHPQGLATAVLSTETTLASFTKWQVGVEAPVAPDQSQFLNSPDERGGAPGLIFDLRRHQTKGGTCGLIGRVRYVPSWRASLFGVARLARTNDAIYRLPPLGIQRLLFDGHELSECAFALVCA